MANIEVPDYKALPCLPSGSTISLWNNRTKVYNVQDNELNKRVVLPPNCQQSWASLFQEDKMFWFAAVTIDEYNSIWHKMECHNSSMVVSAYKAAGIS